MNNVINNIKLVGRTRLKPKIYSREKDFVKNNKM